MQTVRGSFYIPVHALSHMEQSFVGVTSALQKLENDFETNFEPTCSKVMKIPNREARQRWHRRVG
jgi:hypothetical protein